MGQSYNIENHVCHNWLGSWDRAKMMDQIQAIDIPKEISSEAPNDDIDEILDAGEKLLLR